MNYNLQFSKYCFIKFHDSNTKNNMVQSPPPIPTHTHLLSKPSPSFLFQTPLLSCTKYKEQSLFWKTDT